MPIQRVVWTETSCLLQLASAVKKKIEVTKIEISPLGLGLDYFIFVSNNHERVKS
jgi:hypothetical protein